MPVAPHALLFQTQVLDSSSGLPVDMERILPPRARADNVRMPVPAARRGIDTEEDLELANSQWATFTTTES